MPSTCARHPEQPAAYRCDGCGSQLCSSCIEESHSLLLCRLCGERALPLGTAQPQTVRELVQQRKLAGPYGLRDALVYPFRGTGVYLFIVTCGVMALLWVVSFAPGLRALVVQIFLWGLIVGLQFKVARSTAEGENELPDWPDFTAFGPLLQDLLTWVVIHAPQIACTWIYLSAIGNYRVAGARGVAEAPNLLVWIGVAAALWLTSAFAMIAFGAAGNYRRLSALEVHHHVRGFFAARTDAVTLTNLIFGLGSVVLLLRTFLATVPLGQVLGGLIGVYWIFLEPHLAGLLFRRHQATLEALYWPRDRF